jgi:hypothetical protein
MILIGLVGIAIPVMLTGIVWIIVGLIAGKLI